MGSYPIPVAVWVEIQPEVDLELRNCERWDKEMNGDVEILGKALRSEIPPG